MKSVIFKCAVSATALLVTISNLNADVILRVVDTTCAGGYVELLQCLAGKILSTNGITTSDNISSTTTIQLIRCTDTEITVRV